MEERGEILLVDDEESLIHAFEKLARRNQFRLSVARNGLDALEKLASNTVSVALLDLNSSGLDGLQILDYIKKNHLSTEAIMMTGRGSIETAVSSLKSGAYDYLLKPFDDLDHVVNTLIKAQEKAELVRRLKTFETAESSENGFDTLVGQSQKMKDVFDLVVSVAPSESTVLIMGESGTGKELVARSIHKRSFRKERPFIVVNCAALPETLLESELFGHAKGSFTGAVADTKGLFEEADHGTLFLDEIGEIPPSMQVKLLRVLQDGEIRRVGGSEVKHVDVRILSATNKDLYQKVKQGSFREDLFYRLNVITLYLPSLRDKKEDIPLMAYHFMKKYVAKTGKKVGQISLDAMQALQAYDWPGNVRELENVIERAVVLTEGDGISARDLPSKLLGEVFYAPDPKHNGEEDILRLPYHKAKERTIHLFNRSYVSQLLRYAEGNISIASVQAGMDRSNFKKIIKKCEVSVREFKRGREKR
ncbi:MAG: sigma-54-dependent Fis family transcriptional regulator [Deltaproteobacteria bacterium]|nr:sigma-54-dependent Fis family transcriptional regulator [Deltaproteobacteria bacterium]